MSKLEKCNYCGYKATGIAMMGHDILCAKRRKETKQLKRLVITEIVDSNRTRWTLNVDKFNDKTDVEIPEKLARHILELQS